jgi:hypothetical protein
VVVYVCRTNNWNNGWRRRWKRKKCALGFVPLCPSFVTSNFFWDLLTLNNYCRRCCCCCCCCCYSCRNLCCFILFVVVIVVDVNVLDEVSFDLVNISYSSKNFLRRQIPFLFCWRCTDVALLCECKLFQFRFCCFTKVTSNAQMRVNGEIGCLLKAETQKYNWILNTILLKLTQAIFCVRGRGQRPILNFSPRGKLWPQRRLCPQGWNLSPEVKVNPWGPSSPLGIKFAPGGQGWS